MFFGLFSIPLIYTLFFMAEFRPFDKHFHVNSDWDAPVTLNIFMSLYSYQSELDINGQYHPTNTFLVAIMPFDLFNVSTFISSLN